MQKSRNRFLRQVHLWGYYRGDEHRLTKRTIYLVILVCFIISKL